MGVGGWGGLELEPDISLFLLKEWNLTVYNEVVHDMNLGMVCTVLMYTDYVLKESV